MKTSPLPILLILLSLLLLTSCGGLRTTKPSADVPTASRPEDVATADAFFASSKSRGMVPQPGSVPTLTPKNSGYVVELDQQRVYLYHEDRLIAFSKLASGRPGHRTETGPYIIGQKNLNHRSNLYGNYVNSSGSVMLKDVSPGFDPLPVGGKFQGSLMKHFQRFSTVNHKPTAMGFHTGVLPGYPASHGCIRLPDSMANWFFYNTPIGTPVVIRGTKLGVARGAHQPRAKRTPKIHSSLKKTAPPATPATPPAENEAPPPAESAPPAPAPTPAVPEN